MTNSGEILSNKRSKEDEKWERGSQWGGGEEEEEGVGGSSTKITFCCFFEA